MGIKVIVHGFIGEVLATCNPQKVKLLIQLLLNLLPLYGQEMHYKWCKLYGRSDKVGAAMTN
jgi:hypothetical protein